MRHFLIGIVFFLAAAKANAQPEHETMRVMRLWAKAYIDRDTAFLDKVMDESWTFAGGNNFRTNKRDGIEAFKKDKRRYLSIKYYNPEAKTYGNTAVVTTEEEVKLQQENGDTVTSRSLVTDVFVRKKDGWKCVRTHKSPVETGN